MKPVVASGIQVAERILRRGVSLPGGEEEPFPSFVDILIYSKSDLPLKMLRRGISLLGGILTKNSFGMHRTSGK